MSITQKFFKKINSTHTLYIATFLFLLTFFMYGNTLFNGLFFDDEDFIYNNVYVKNFSIDKFFTQNLIAGASKVSNYYRPLLLVTYGVEHSIFGFLPFIYHFDNILLQACCAILLFVVLKKILNNSFVALLTSSLFAVHPIEIEAVSYASGRNDPLSLLFMLLSIFFYLRQTRKYFWISILFFITALLSRETAIIFPALLVLIEILCHPELVSGSLKKALLIKKYLVRTIPFFVISFFYFFLRVTVLNFQNTLNFYNSQNTYSSHLYIRLLTFLSILPKYFGLLLLPKTLYMERDVSIVTTFFNSWVIFGFLILILSFLISYHFRKKHPIFLFCFLWFYITIAPTSGIIPINGIMYEHFLYLPSIGFFITFSYLFFLLLKNFKSEKVKLFLLISCCLLLICLGMRTILRNFDWHDPIAFYNQILKYSPKVSRVHNNLAMAYAENGENQKAITEYKAAMKLADVYPQTHYNLANTYINANKINDAEFEYLQAIRIDPKFYQAYINLIKLYVATNQKLKREEILSRVENISKRDKSFIPILEYLKSI